MYLLLNGVAVDGIIYTYRNVNAAFLCPDMYVK